jgi:predicted RNase H-like nuclease
LKEKRAFFEVYPHPSIVVLFKLDKILQYKNKPKRDYEFRYKEFERYLGHLANLGKSDVKLILPDEILKKDIRKLRAQNLKSFEDTLDSILCGYIAYYYWKLPDKCAVLGNMKEGYILTPIFDFMKREIKGSPTQKKIAEF